MLLQKLGALYAKSSQSGPLPYIFKAPPPPPPPKRSFLDRTLIGRPVDTLTIVPCVLQASCKAKKFFVKMEEFWVPSKDEKMLYQQLNQKKFREIMKEQLV